MTQAIERLVAGLTSEPGVLGVAQLRQPSDGARRLRVLVAAEWNAFRRLSAALPCMGRAALGRPDDDGDEGLIDHHAVDTWTGVDSDRVRLELRVVRMSDLLPSALGEGAEALHDPRGLMEQWIRWSRGRPPAEPAVETPGKYLLEIDALVRSLVQLPPGARRLDAHGRSEPARPPLAARLRRALRAHADPPAWPASLVQAAHDALACVPGAGAGVLVVGADGEDSAYSRFLGTADAEGFRGDRVLFDAAAQQLGELARRPPQFELGYFLPTFDQVEGLFSVAEAAGGCQAPLVPGIYVGVGVTPADALEFWAGPSVRPAGSAYAAVADDGTRLVVPRSEGLDALLEAQGLRIESAWDELETYLGRARGAMAQPLGEPAAALRSLSLPRSHIDLAVRCLGESDTGSTRFDLCLALLRAAEDVTPLVARKLWLSAGRVIAASDAGPRKAGAPAPCSS